jgi:hypothetical protein
MNLFKKYYQLVESTAEIRYYHSKGLEPPKRLSNYEQLEKYKDDPDIYVSFRDIKKIGINPQSRYNTPMGIYSYPLSLIWKDFDHLNKKIEVPHAMSENFIFIFEPRNKSKGLFLTKYNENDFKIDVEKLKKSQLIDNERLESLLLLADKLAKVKTWGGKIWFITHSLVLKNKSIEKIISDQKSGDFQTESQSNIILWNKLLYKTLGYDYIIDDAGEEIIHHNEPTQAVFFSSSIINVIDIIENQYSFIYKAHTSSDSKYEYLDVNHALWQSGHWYDGVWKGGEWIDGVWHKGTWEDGTWYNGTWLSGIWIKGEWRGGYDKYGESHPKGDSPNKWDIK